MQNQLLTLLIIITSLNGYSQVWVTQQSNTTSHLRDVHFIDANNGCAVGSNGTICKTSDGGNNWILQSSGTTESISSVYFTDTLTGFAVTPTELLKTTDGGNNWFVQDTMNASMIPIFFIGNDIGFVVGKGRMLKTIDGGDSWTKHNSSDVYTYCFWATDSNTLYTGGMGGATMGPTPTVAKSMDGGENWSTLYQPGAYGSFSSMFFTTQNTGYIAGSYFMQGNNYNLFAKTTDGGVSWSYDSSTINLTLTSIFFIDSLIGYVTATDGSILKTIDAGENWIPLNSNVTTSLNSIFFPDSLTGYTVGASGTILKTANAGLGIGEQTIEESLIIFPNPTSTQLTIKIGSLAIDKIDIIDITGKKIKSIKKNITTINVADLPSGIYFIKLFTEEKIITKKFVKQ